MKQNLPLYILAAVILLVVLVLGVFPMVLRSFCWREAVAAANEASKESGVLERAFGVGSADYNAIRDQKYGECLARRGLSD